MTQLRVRGLRAWAALLGMVLVLGVGPAMGAASASPLPTASPSSVGATGHRPHVLPFGASGTAGPSQVPHAASMAPAASGPQLSYYGGKVLANVKVVQVIYGAGTYLAQTTADASPGVSSFYQGVTASPYFDWLSEYNTTGNAAGGQPGTNQVIGRGSFSGRYVITPSAANNGNAIQDANIQAELNAQIAAGHLPAPDANTLYSLFFRNGQSICAGSSCSLVSGGFCAYHNTIAAGSLPELYYAVEPDLSNVIGCGAGNAFQNTTSVASHEMIESVTDPGVGLADVYGPPLGWYDGNYGEIGDICNGQQDTVTGGDGVTYTVQKQFSNVAGHCIVSRTTTNDFSVTASPASLSVARSSSVTATVSVSVTAGAAQSVVLGASGMPAGVTASFSPASVTTGSSARLTLSTGATTAGGTYNVVITGTGVSATRTTSVSLVVSVPVVNNFSIAASPATLTADRGSSAVATISTAVTAGAAQSVVLSASGLPAGVVASFSPASITAGSSARLTLATSSTVAGGTYAVVVTGTGPSATQTTPLSLVVSVPVVANFSLGVSPASLALVRGSSGAVTVVTGVAAGAAQTVALSASGLPAGVVASFSPASITAGTTSRLTLTTSSAMAAGTYAIVITGTGRTATQTTPLSLVVSVPVVANFSISANPASLSMDRGSSGVATIATAVTAGSAQTVVFGASDLPAGVVASFSPTSVAAGGSARLTLSASSGAAGGTYAIVIAGAGPSATHTTTLTLRVSVPAPPPVSTGAVVNGGFETGTLAGWTPGGAAVSVVSDGCHSGNYCARLGSTVAAKGDSTLTQTFTAPAGSVALTFGYKMACTGNATGDSATATLRDAAGGTLVMPLPMMCSLTGWWQVGVYITPGHTYTLTLVNHNSGIPTDPTYALFDDVAFSSTGMGPSRH